jgi:hypothetical protein
MNSVLFTLLKWALVVGMGVITFMPTYGVVALNIAYMTTFPYMVIATDLIWLSAIALVLPFGLRIFRITSSVFVGSLLGLGTLMTWQTFPNVFNAMPWYMWIVVNVSGVIGWLLVASPLWRWMHTTMPVDNQTAPVHNDQSGNHH